MLGESKLDCRYMVNPRIQNIVRDKLIATKQNSESVQNGFMHLYKQGVSVSEILNMFVKNDTYCVYRLTPEERVETVCLNIDKKNAKSVSDCYTFVQLLGDDNKANLKDLEATYLPVHPSPNKQLQNPHLNALLPTRLFNKYVDLVFGALKTPKPR